MSTNSKEQKLPSKFDPPPPISPCHVFLDTAEAALYLRLSRSCLAKWRCEGGAHHPAYHLVGRKVVYAVADLEAWLASRRRRSTSDSGN